MKTYTKLREEMQLTMLALTRITANNSKALKDKWLLIVIKFILIFK